MSCLLHLQFYLNRPIKGCYLPPTATLSLPPPSHVLVPVHPHVVAQSNVQEAMDDKSEAASSDLVDQLDTDSSESRNQDLVSDVWTEFFKIYRHPFGFKDSISPKSARIWLKGLNKGDVEYICELCMIQPGSGIGCDCKSIQCQLCVERYHACSCTNAFRKQMIMEKLRLEEMEYDYLVKLVPPKGSGVYNGHVGTGIHEDSGTGGRD